MNYLRDTNICVYWLSGRQSIEQTAMEKRIENLAISFITLSELYYGAYKSAKVEKNMFDIETNRVLVTNNEKHFSRIRGLNFENWV